MLSRIGPRFYIVLGCGQLFLLLSGKAWNEPQPLSANVAVAAFGVCMLFWGIAPLLQRSHWPRASQAVMVLASVTGLVSIAAWAVSFPLGIMMLALFMLPSLILFLVPRILSRGSAYNDTRQ